MATIPIKQRIAQQWPRFIVGLYATCGLIYSIYILSIGVQLDASNKMRFFRPFGGSSSMGPEEEDRMVKATLLIFGIYSVIVNSIGLYATIRKSVAAAKASFIIWIIQVSWICLSIVLLFIALFSLSERDRDQLPKPSAKAYVQVFVDLLRTSIHGWALFVFLRDLKGRQRNALGFLVKEGGVFEYEPLEPGRVHL